MAGLSMDGSAGAAEARTAGASAEVELRKFCIIKKGPGAQRLEKGEKTSFGCGRARTGRNIQFVFTLDFAVMLHAIFLIAGASIAHF